MKQIWLAGRDVHVNMNNCVTLCAYIPCCVFYDALTKAYKFCYFCRKCQLWQCQGTMGSCLGVSMQICNFLKDLKHVAMSLHNLKYVL